MPTKPRTTATPRVKITYTYNDITFSTASKVVAKMAKSGNLEGAYNRYISDTVGRELRKVDMAKATRQQWMRSIKAGISTAEEAKAAKRAYEQQVGENIEKAIRKQYEDVLSQLKDSNDPALRKIAEKLSEIIEAYSDRYRAENNEKMQQEMQQIIDQAKTDLSEEGLQALLNAELSMDSAKQQELIRKKMRESNLSRRKSTGTQKKKVHSKGTGRKRKTGKGKKGRK